MSKERFPQVGQYATGFCRLSMSTSDSVPLLHVGAWSFHHLSQFVIVDLRSLDYLRGSKSGNVRGLEALWTLGNFKFNSLTFVQRFVAVSLNGRKVNENVLARLALDEPKALAGIEPLDCPLFSHVSSF
jgi:hypothetical protein